MDMPIELMGLAIECEPEDAGVVQPLPPPLKSARSVQMQDQVAHDQAAQAKVVGVGGAARPIDDDELAKVCQMLREAIAMRERYAPAESETLALDPDNVTPDENPPSDPFVPAPCNGVHFSFEMRRGIMVVWEEDQARLVGPRKPGRKDDRPPAFESPPSLAEFTKDLARLLTITSDAAVNSFCYKRLQKLEARFKLHVMEQEQEEAAEQCAVPHRDFYNVRKVDTHVHLAAAMNQKHLLRFIKRKMRYHADEVVTKSASTGEPMTLQEVFEDMGITPYDLSIDALGMHTDSNTFARFDKFNLKYNPLGKSKLREIFLKTENMLGGRYFAEITQELFDDLAFSKYQKAEYRISIYGRSKNEWDDLAAWVVDHQLFSNHNRWLIQIPRLYGMYQANRLVRTFAEMLDNIFTPLFEVTADPATHPKLHLLLQQVVGFDSVDDESKAEGPLPTPDSPAVHPEQWTEDNPHYAYYCFYMYANLQVLNRMRARQGLSTFCFRPHAGEAGEQNHLHAAFLTARGINHGINLRKSPSMQYLYYLAQIGLALSPLSNNALFLQLSKSPFHEFFAVGLNVSLSTDDPLMFHHTREPLMEEYTIAKQVWKLSSVDLSEVARNSVLQSSFPPHVKAFWIGGAYWRGGCAGNDIHRTNVPNMRLKYRELALAEEIQVVRDSYLHAPAALPHLSPSLQPISSAQIAAQYNAGVTSAGPRPLAPRTAAPPPPPTVTSPKRHNNQEHDGPFPRLYEPPPKFERGGGGGNANGGVNLPPAYGRDAPIPPGGSSMLSAPSAYGGGGGRSGRLRKPYFGKGASGDGPQAPPPAASELVERLDAQHMQLMQFQQMAMAAEERADAAMRVNRYLMVGLAAAALVAMARSR